MQTHGQMLHVQQNAGELIPSLGSEDLESLGGVGVSSSLADSVAYDHLSACLVARVPGQLRENGYRLGGLSNDSHDSHALDDDAPYQIRGAHRRPVPARVREVVLVQLRIEVKVTIMFSFAHSISIDYVAMMRILSRFVHSSLVFSGLMILIGISFFARYADVMLDSIKELYPKIRQFSTLISVTTPSEILYVLSCLAKNETTNLQPVPFRAAVPLPRRGKAGGLTHRAHHPIILSRRSWLITIKFTSTTIINRKAIEVLNSRRHVAPERVHQPMTSMNHIRQMGHDQNLEQISADGPHPSGPWGLRCGIELWISIFTGTLPQTTPISSSQSSNKSSISRVIASISMFLFSSVCSEQSMHEIWILIGPDDDVSTDILRTESRPSSVKKQAQLIWPH
ncbi:uncharacterized protein MYCFIDRAFT_180076 [Pseudocercospora fijiensis CIRAD86]|uniref:Uncharacterized protein n=1 Tax=Pseudocercospora fijiensis (strain CIRAD86) TaxID=383855 RepID=M2ZDM7_PSEFD|nr:uncharacterized protein MYCFIDRAFT_180076 [Pseudocercospora fijiensis CIRAD86]EME77199.1 hypothetical protein MYCFIDRAFT_180076 [Pseudocercospora fijiensis CIRAD86]